MPGIADVRAVTGRIRALVRGGAARIVLTGGEPTLRRDLPRLVSFAKAAGAREVWMETNAVALNERRVALLQRSGLDGVRVHLSGFTDELDAVTQDPGGFQAAKRGFRSVLQSGLMVDVVSVLSNETLNMVAPMPGHLAAFLSKLGSIRCWWLVVVSSVPDEALWPDAPSLLSTIATVIEHAKEVDLPVKLEPKTAPPPCVFPRPAVVVSAYALSSGGSCHPQFERIDACSSCLLLDRCPGMHRAQRKLFSEIEPRPVSDDAVRRRMTMIGTVREQVERELVEPGTYRDDQGHAYEEAIIRFSFRCNQRCRFCFVSTHLPDPPEWLVRQAIEEASLRGARIVISGGEPTLNASFLSLAHLAAKRSRHPVQLQTNAIAFAVADLARQVADAGVREAFVSLHAACAEVSDAITGAPGSFAATCDGVERLVAAGVQVTLNFVLFRSNLGELEAWVRMAVARWPAVRLNLSFVAPATDLVPQDDETVPRYSEVLPTIVRAIEAARELGVRLGGFESMCGLPLCLVPDGLEPFFQLPEIPADSDRGEFVKPSTCDRCTLRSRCFGIRRGYVALHGVRELKCRL